jgi:hypothetical protein
MRSSPFDSARRNKFLTANRGHQVHWKIFEEPQSCKNAKNHSFGPAARSSFEMAYLPAYRRCVPTGHAIVPNGIPRIDKVKHRFFGFFRFCRKRLTRRNHGRPTSDFRAIFLFDSDRHSASIHREKFSKGPQKIWG